MNKRCECKGDAVLQEGKRGEISILSEEMTKRISELQIVIEDLESILQSILSDKGDGDEITEKRPQPETQLGDELLSYNLRLEGLIDRVKELQSRIQL